MKKTQALSPIRSGTNLQSGARRVRPCIAVQVDAQPNPDYARCGQRRAAQ